MNTGYFQLCVAAIAVVFCVIFGVVVLPPLIVNPDVYGAFAAGFVNPYASGYASDIFACWAILAVWILYEKRSLGIKHGWACLLLGVVPGVAVGLAGYLILRTRQLSQNGTPSA